MNYGVILLIIALIFAIIGKQNRTKNSFLIISTILFLGFSYNMGGDWRAYKLFYEKITPKLSISNPLNTKFEEGYIILNYIFNKLGINYELFQAIVLILCIFIILKLVEKKSKNFYIAFVYIFIQFLFSYSAEPILRQFIATTLIIIGFKYIEERKILKYLIWVFLAFQFHKSAIIGIIFYLSNYLNFKSKKKILICIILAFIISLNIDSILNLLIRLIPFLHTYSGYLRNEIYSSIAQRSLMGNLYLIITVCIYFAIIIYTKYEKEYRVYLNLAILGIIFGIFANRFFILVRFNSYFVFPIAITISNIDRLNFNLKIKKLCIFFILFIQIFTKYYTILRDENSKKRYYYYQNYLIEVFKGKNTKSYYLRESFMRNLDKDTIYD